MRLNFLVGVNGSGKSAVLTAIVFALGGSARMANRGTSNKTFIKTGQTTATVDVKLCNVGALEYKVGTRFLLKLEVYNLNKYIFKFLSIYLFRCFRVT